MASAGDLQEKIAEISGRKTAAKLRKLMPAIEAKFSEGVTHQEMVEALNAHGMSLNINTFRSNLYRWRTAQSGGRAAIPEDPAVPAKYIKPAVCHILSDGNSGGRPQTPRIENKGDMKRARQNFDFDELAAAADKNDTDQ